MVYFLSQQGWYGSIDCTLDFLYYANCIYHHREQCRHSPRQRSHILRYESRQIMSSGLRGSFSIFKFDEIHRLKSMGGTTRSLEGLRSTPRAQLYISLFKFFANLNAALIHSSICGTHLVPLRPSLQVTI